MYLMRCCELAQVPNKKFIDGSVPHYNVPYILEDGSLRKNLEDCAAEMAAVVYSYGQWVVDVEDLDAAEEDHQEGFAAETGTSTRGGQNGRAIR